MAKQQSSTKSAPSSSSSSSAAKTLAAEPLGTGGRARIFYIIAALLALVGLTDAIYLTINHLTGQTARCTVAGGCNEVLGSAYATLGPFPVASLGAAAYFAVFSLATLAFFDYKRARTLLFILVAIMLCMTLWLLFVQAFILHKFCDYCMISAAITVSLSIIMFILRFAPKAL